MDSKSDKMILQVADKVNELLCQLQSDSISIPQLVVVGAQSSGKSTLINKSVGFDLLPIGDNMVTRTPIHIRLHNIEVDTSYATLSILDNSVMKVVYRTNIDDKNQQADDIQKNIVKVTDKITANKFSISKTPIFVDIYSQRVTNISFIDLPGLVTIACTDKGQSENIVTDIKDLVQMQLSRENTIVMVVIQSKNDLETDIGLALVKELQRTQPSIKTIGVMTKPDLLDKDKQIKLGDIVAGKISKSVMLDDGYFIVNNKVDNESEWFEKIFGVNNNVITGKRCGVKNLLMYIQKYLVNVIKENIPNTKYNLAESLKKIKTKINKMGNDIKDNDSKIGYVGRIIYQLNQAFVNSLESKGTVPNGGYEIKKIFQQFIETTTRLNPFDESELDDSYIQTIIDSFDGYHMTTQASIIQLLERCIYDKGMRPVMKIMPHISTCIQKVDDLIESLARNLLSSTMTENINVYPRLKESIINHLVTLIKSYGGEVNDILLQYLSVQEDFIWTSDTKFQNMMAELTSIKTTNKGNTSSTNLSTFSKTLTVQTITQKEIRDESVINTYNVNQVRQLAKYYFATIVTNCQDITIKTIVSKIIKKLEREFTITMTRTLIGNGIESINELFWEDPEMAKERTTLIKHAEKIQETIDQINKYISTK